MTTYYPSQAGYATTQPMVAQPMVGYPATAGYGQYGMAGSYAQPGGVMVQPQVATTMGTPMVVQPTYATGHSGYGHHYNHFSIGARLRRFFGLAPSNGVRYKSDRGTWGFMGYSRRQRYMDPRTGGEVDRHGRPVYRV
ncbi:hypothetical protein JR316_0005010 [Psilocybe cubensis]|uniref:Uncharacterized protein n=2 Tax=Psilocybe cubensis TaxID=181762 RepID=A0A8H7XYM2_PSICU|nr:hypothetical protein JR316_0005010 [Psilocybe cubensis]KAH9482910.1 hypothetical protein JR316_0005010 [Psilocybe cubensis]